MLVNTQQNSFYSEDFMTIFLLEYIKHHIFKSVGTVMGAIAGFGFGCFGSSSLILSYDDIDEEFNKGITAILAVETFLSLG